MQTIDNVLTSLESHITEGLKKRLPSYDAARILATFLFEMTKILPEEDKLIEVRDYQEIKERGTFKYSGQADTMHAEGLIPDDVYEGLKEVGGKHIGPSYLRVKGLLTDQQTRTFFGIQMAYLIQEYLLNKPLEKSDGYVVCIPNMTGGVWIGDETRRQLGNILTEYRVWPRTPYARGTRKAIDTIAPNERFVDYIEGIVPSPDETAAILCFEELRTTAETTQNATRVYRGFGYNEKNGVRIVEACVFDYNHPVGVERLDRLGVDRLYLVDGETFIKSSLDLGYVNESKYQTVMDWLNNPWRFTRRVLPDVRRLAGK